MISRGSESITHFLGCRGNTGNNCTSTSSIMIDRDEPPAFIQSACSPFSNMSHYWPSTKHLSPLLTVQKWPISTINNHDFTIEKTHDWTIKNYALPLKNMLCRCKKHDFTIKTNTDFTMISPIKPWFHHRKNMISPWKNPWFHHDLKPNYLSSSISSSARLRPLKGRHHCSTGEVLREGPLPHNQRMDCEGMVFLSLVPN